MIILDTNAISELLRPKVDPSFAHWLSLQPASELWTTSVSVAEMRFGMEILHEGKRKALGEVLDRLFEEDLDGRVLPFDYSSAIAFGALLAQLRAIGRPIEWADAQIAAIAQVRGAPVATRNIKHFENCGVELINPWDGLIRP